MKELRGFKYPEMEKKSSGLKCPELENIYSLRFKELSRLH